MIEPVAITRPTLSLRCWAIVIDQLQAEPHPCTRLATVLRPCGDVKYYPLCSHHALGVLEGDRT